ncbi:MAG: hypothetical protein HIU89_02605 [Proteobacteria bacterium]|nr:hypothetical protein [Pseudomonadota bacterium]
MNPAARLGVKGTISAGYNIQWLLRPTVRLVLGPAFLRRLRLMLWAVQAASASQSAQNHGQALA